MTARYGKSNMHWAEIFCNKDLFLDYCARYQTWFIVQSKKETKSLNPFQSTMKLICIQIKLHDMGWIQCHSKLKLRWTSIVCLAYECNWLKHKSKVLLSQYINIYKYIYFIICTSCLKFRFSALINAYCGFMHIS